MHKNNFCLLIFFPRKAEQKYFKEMVYKKNMPISALKFKLKLNI